MKTLSITAALFFFTVGVLAGAQEEEAETPAKPETVEEQVSYSLGINLGRNLLQQGAKLNLEFLVTGLKDGLSGAEALMSEEDMRVTMRAFQQGLAATQQERLSALGAKNKEQGEAFLAANKEREGVVTLPSGLQYEVIDTGSGPSPQAVDQVTVNYRGTLIDGTQFDSSYDRGQPATFPVAGIILGWSEALQLMNAGSKWKLYVPPDLAYGQRGAGAIIGPNATLIFEIQLLSIEGQE